MNTYAKKGDVGEVSPSEHKGFCSTVLRVRPYCDVFPVIVHLRFVYFRIKIQMARTV